MEPKSSRLLTGLRRAIRKVQFLLSFNASRWVLSSILGGSSSMNRRRRLSFKSQPSGLLDICSSADDDYQDAGSSFTLSRTASLASPGSDITRTTSDSSTTSAADDINQRADDFIANFYKHIQMERQVSLELRYCGGKDGLERTKSE